ncbi:MAG: glycosyltransferase family 39 protein [bacterium]|nr:glycosyltransferase family 39 protein [bacterium]
MNSKTVSHKKKLLYTSLYLAIISIVFFILTVASIRYKSATIDEPVIIASGNSYLRNHNNYINAENPPLFKSILAAPTYFMNLNLPKPSQKYNYTYNTHNIHNYGVEFLFKNNFELILFYSRVINILFGLCTAFAIYFLLRIFFNHIYSCFGFTICLLLPNFVANARLATVDIGITLFMTLTCLFYYYSLHKEKFKWHILTGLSLGAALLSKYTAILLIPILFLQLISKLIHDRNKKYNIVKKISALLLIIILAILLVNLLYFSSADIYANNPIFRSKYFTIFPWVTKLISSILPYGYLKGFDIVSSLNAGRFANIFMGKLYRGGESWWYYYIVVSLLKIPIPIIILFFIGLITIINRYYKKWKFYFFLFPPLIIVFTFSFIAGRQLGLKYLLPAYPYLIIIIVYAVKELFKRKTVFKLLASILIFWLIFDNIVIYPNYLTYVNQFFINSADTKKYFGDVNLDIGQDLPSLKNWLAENNDPPIYVYYYGPTRLKDYHIKQSANPKYIAVSATMFYISKKKKMIQILSEEEPLTIINNTIYIYKISSLKKHQNITK